MSSLSCSMYVFCCSIGVRCCYCCSWRSVHMDGSPCANAITASGYSTRADSGGAAPPNSRIRLIAVALLEPVLERLWGSLAMWTGRRGVGIDNVSVCCQLVAVATDSRTKSFLERVTGARLPLKTALVLTWLIAGSIVFLFVKALAVWKVIPPSVAAGSSSEAAAAAPASPSAHSFPLSHI